MENNFKLSVALVTRNRPESLIRTLKSLRSQRVQPWEVIVSDDSESLFQERVREIATEYNCQYIKGPMRGLYANRNHVARACTGTHIRTMDDDHEFPDKHIEECLKAVELDPTSIWIIGEYLVGQMNLTRPVDCPGQLHPRGFSVTPADPQNCFALADGATIYPRKIFDEGNFFLESFKFGAVYLEMGSRLFWKGYRIRHLATTYILHHYEPATRSFTNIEIDLSARIFAMLCHSFMYQPTIRNKTLTTLEIVRLCLTHLHLARSIFSTGLKNYLQRRKLNLVKTSLKERYKTYETTSL